MIIKSYKVIHDHSEDTYVFEIDTTSQYLLKIEANCAAHAADFVRDNGYTLKSDISEGFCKETSRVL